jgi:hypothetical protein
MKYSQDRTNLLFTLVFAVSKFSCRFGNKMEIERPSTLINGFHNESQPFTVYI